MGYGSLNLINKDWNNIKHAPPLSSLLHTNMSRNNMHCYISLLVIIEIIVNSYTNTVLSLIYGNMIIQIIHNN